MQSRTMMPHSPLLSSRHVNTPLIIWSQNPLKLEAAPCLLSLVTESSAGACMSAAQSIRHLPIEACVHNNRRAEKPLEAAEAGGRPWG